MVGFLTTRMEFIPFLEGKRSNHYNKRDNIVVYLLSIELNRVENMERERSISLILSMTYRLNGICIEAESVGCSVAFELYRHGSFMLHVYLVICK